MELALQISFAKVQFDCAAGVFASGHVGRGAVDEGAPAVVVEVGVVLLEDAPVAAVVAAPESADEEGVVPVLVPVEEVSAVVAAAGSGSIFMPLIWV